MKRKTHKIPDAAVINGDDNNNNNSPKTPTSISHLHIVQSLPKSRIFHVLSVPYKKSDHSR